MKGNVTHIDANPTNATDIDATRKVVIHMTADHINALAHAGGFSAHGKTVPHATTRVMILVMMNASTGVMKHAGTSVGTNVRKLKKN